MSGYYARPAREVENAWLNDEAIRRCLDRRRFLPSLHDHDINVMSLVCRRCGAGLSDLLNEPRSCASVQMGPDARLGAVES